MSSAPVRFSVLPTLSAIILIAVASTTAFALPEHKVSVPLPVMEKPLVKQPFPTNPMEKVSPGMYRIGEVTIDKKARSVSFPAVVNMQRGLLEYVVVRSGGKTHESLLRTKAEPYDIQLACLLLGLEGTDTPLPFQGAPAKPKGEPVTISIFLPGVTGAAGTVQPEQWIAHLVDKQLKDVANLQLVFTGSITRNGRFIAQQEGSIAALYHDPVALIDNASPGGEVNRSWFVREGSVPPVGTPVTVVIKAGK
jgi:hypothetical protein